MGVDPKTLGQNLYLLIGLFFGLGLLALLGLAVATAVRSALSIRDQRKSWRQYVDETRRADGQLYPPTTAGICQQCGRPDDKTYLPSSGQRLCITCYDAFWRREEGFTGILRQTHAKS